MSALLGLEDLIISTEHSSIMTSSMIIWLKKKLSGRIKTALKSTVVDPVFEYTYNKSNYKNFSVTSFSLQEHIPVNVKVN